MRRAQLILFVIFSALILFSVSMYSGGFKSQDSDASAEYTFESEPVDVEGFEVRESSIKDSPIRIMINSVGINLPVNKSYVINGYWEVFEDTAGWGDGSGFPGETGNQVIFAHARDGLFKSLQGIELGDKVLVFTNTNWFEYEVFDIKEVFPDQLEVIAPTSDERLTLYTCFGFQDEKRLIVTAKRI